MCNPVARLLLVGMTLIPMSSDSSVAQPVKDEPAAAALNHRGGSPEFHYMHRGEPVRLRLDPLRAAILSRPADQLAGRPPGPQEIAGTPLPVPDWRLVSPAAPADADSLKLLVAETADFVSPIFLDARGGDVLVTPDILVRFRANVTADAARNALRAVACQVVQADFAGLKNLFRVRIDLPSGFDVLEAANTLADHPDVEFAEPNLIVTARPLKLIPNDEHFSRCWGLHATGQDIVQGLDLFPPLPPTFAVPDFDMDVPEAWDITTGDPGIIVVVFDQGVQLDHPDLMINPALGRDFTTGVPGGIPGGGPITACDNHGTTVAGVIGAKMNNNIGGVGVAPNARVASARVIVNNCSTEFLEFAWVVEGLAWADRIGARITNHSYTWSPPSAAFAAKIADTRDTMLHFGAAGNDGTAGITYPASLGEFFAVAQTHPVLADVFESNYGPELDACAPGVGILTTDRTGSDGYSLFVVQDDYVFMLGTSFSAPMAAGVAALVLSADPSLTPDQADVLLRRSCTDMGSPGFDPIHGHGHINAHRAVRWARCPADHNLDGVPNSQDFFDFVADFLSLAPRADFNNDSAINSQDFFDFLTAFFAGCP